MTPAVAPASMRRLAAPANAALLTVAAVAWAFPQGLALFRALAIVVAWAGTALVVASLVLMVREPHVAAFFGGLDTMYLWHHRAGVAGYVLLLAHPLALAADGWTQSRAMAWQAIAPWTQDWPVWTGWVALALLMAGLAATFARAIGYRRWRILHYLLGLAVVLGLVHVYALLGNEPAVLALVALAMVGLVWRLAGADLGLDSHPYRVTAVVRRASQMIEITLAPFAAALRVAPGQFVLAGFGDGEHFHGCAEFHPFTVSGIGTDGTLRVSVKALGRCTEHVQEVEPGVRVRLQGPFGSFLADTASAPQLWIAGGVGITPFIAALRAGGAPASTTLIYLYRTGADAAFLDELDAIAHSNPAVTVIAAATGSSVPDFDALLAQVDDLAAREVRICGPQPMVQAVQARLLERGLPASAIHFESFDFR